MKKGIIQLLDQVMILHIQVSPKSSKAGWGKIVNNESIQLKINAPPVDGAANKVCIKFLVKQFKSNKSSIQILSGEKSRYKTFEISNFSMEKVEDFIKTYLTA